MSTLTNHTQALPNFQQYVVTVERLGEQNIDVRVEAESIETAEEYALYFYPDAWGIEARLVCPAPVPFF